MGKADELRALREARYARNSERLQKMLDKPGMREKVEKRRADMKAADIDNDKGAPYQKPDLTGLCGHRAISGKTCIRPKDHSEKNHRYAK